MQNGEKENQVKELENNKNKKKSKIVREVLVPILQFEWQKTK